MKTLKKILKLSLILILMINSSCQTQDEECYSCSESVDKWAKLNKSEIQQMNRQDIIKLTGSKQRAAFRISTPTKRKALIINKLIHVKSFVNSEPEKEFIERIINIGEKIDFSKEMSKSDMLKYEELINNKAQEFNWNKEFIVYAFGTLQDMNTDTNSNEDFFNQKTAPSHEVDCNCNWGWCPGNDCEDSTCDETNTGCGFLLLGTCDDICGGHGHD